MGEEVISAAVLRNRGAPADLLVIGDDGSPVIDADGSPKVERVWVRFTANEIAEMEDAYFDRDDAGRKRQLAEVLEERLTESPQKTIRDLLAMALAVDPRSVGSRMDPARINDYSTAVGTAFAIAMGTDPLVAKRIFDAGVQATATIREAVTAQVTELLNDLADDSPGVPGSADGQGPPEPVVSVVPSASSGP